MRIEIYHGHRLEQYDTTDQLPMHRFQAFNHALLLDAAVGSDLGDVMAHNRRAMAYVRAGKTKEALDELANQDRLFRFLIARINPGMNAFCALLKSVDEVPHDDVSGEGFRRTIDKLDRLAIPVSWWKRVLKQLRVQLRGELDLLFPDLGGDQQRGPYLALLKQQATVALRAVGEELLAGAEKTVEEIEGRLLGFYPPQRSAGAKGSEVTYLRDSGQLLALVTRWSGQDARQLSVRAFYEALASIESQTKKR